MDKVKIVEKYVDKVMMWLVELANEYRSKRKYRRASEALAMRATLGDALRPFIHYVKYEYNPRQLLVSYGELYYAMVELLYNYADLNPELVHEAFDKVIDTATEVVLERLCGKRTSFFFGWKDVQEEEIKGSKGLAPLSYMR